MQFCDHMEEVLKGVRKELWLRGPGRLWGTGRVSSHLVRDKGRKKLLP